MSQKRAEGVTCPVVDAWIDTVGKAFEKYGLNEYCGDELAKRLWNADETGLCLDATSKKVLARRGVKAVYEVGGRSGHELSTSQYLGAAQPMGSSCLHLSFTRQRIFGQGGPKMVKQEPHTVSQIVGGLRKPIFASGLTVHFRQPFPTY